MTACHFHGGFPLKEPPSFLKLRNYYKIGFRIIVKINIKFNVFKIAISNLAWDKSKDQQVLGAMHGLGIYNLEVSPFRDLANTIEVDTDFNCRVSKLLDSYGIHIVALQSLMFRYPKVSIFENKNIRSDIFKHLISVLRFSKKVGSNIVVFGSPKNKIKGRMPRKEAHKIARGFFGKIALEAQKFNITFCIEPTPVAYGADFIRNTKEAVDLIKAVGHKSLKINLDIGSSILNKEKVKKIIRDNVKYIGHVHISEPHLKTINFNPTFHKSIAKALNGSAYDGIVSIEMLTDGKNSLRNIRKVVSFVKNIYEPKN